MKKVLKKLYEYFIVAVAGTLNALSVHIFVNANNFVPGGFTGVATTVYYFLPDVHYSIIYLVINVPLLIAAIILLRGDFTVKTIFATIVCTLVLRVLPDELVFRSSPVMATIIGGIFIGTSMHIASQVNGSNGGTEIIGRIVGKYKPEIDLSTIIMICNICTVTLGCILVIFFKHQSAFIVLYSLAYVMVGGACMGMLGRGLDHPKKYMIVTTNPDPMKEEILSTFKRGVTVIDVYDDDSNLCETKKILLVIVQYRQAYLLKRIINKHDDSAFTFVKSMYDVFSRPKFNRGYKYEKHGDIK